MSLRGGQPLSAAPGWPLDPQGSSGDCARFLGSRTWQSFVAPGRGEFRTDLLHEGRRSGDAWTRSRAGPLGRGYTKKGERVSDDVFSPLRGKIVSSVFVFAYRSHGKENPLYPCFITSVLLETFPA